MRCVRPPHCRLMLLLPFYYQCRGDRFNSSNWVAVVIFFELPSFQVNIASSRATDEGTGPMPIRLRAPLSSAFRPSSDTNSERRSVPTAMRRLPRLAVGTTAAAAAAASSAGAAAATRLPCRCWAQQLKRRSAAWNKPTALRPDAKRRPTDRPARPGRWLDGPCGRRSARTLLVAGDAGVLCSMEWKINLVAPRVWAERCLE